MSDDKVQKGVVALGRSVVRQWVVSGLMAGLLLFWGRVQPCGFGAASAELLRLDVFTMIGAGLPKSAPVIASRGGGGG